MCRAQNHCRFGIVSRGLGAKKYKKYHGFSKIGTKNHENHRKSMDFIENQWFSQVQTEASFRRRGLNQNVLFLLITSCLKVYQCFCGICDIDLLANKRRYPGEQTFFLNGKSWFFIDFHWFLRHFRPGNQWYLGRKSMIHIDFSLR